MAEVMQSHEEFFTPPRKEELNLINSFGLDLDRNQQQGIVWAMRTMAEEGKISGFNFDDGIKVVFNLVEHLWPGQPKVQARNKKQIEKKYLERQQKLQGLFSCFNPNLGRDGVLTASRAFAEALANEKNRISKVVRTTRVGVRSAGNVDVQKLAANDHS